MQKYYLLSLKWSKQKDQYTWWGPNNSGYTTDIQTAGIYTEEEINKRKHYYSNTGVMPIPVEVVGHAKKQVVIPTINENFKLFGIDEHLKTAKEY
ncbi:hypothetical protein MKY04_12800 [Lysinibacillus telephonicus]|uniref:hypothetical protein n=1 Tax=Lysinibacillus telephonicus TaxID=1714840 RepID=UPI0031FC5FFF